jgi:small conductance mechanosensitive channel
MSKPFALGDYVDTSDGSGTVEEITLTHVKLDTPDGQRLVLPSSKVTAGKIINYTTLGKRRVDHTITASYDDSSDAVRKACLRAVERTKGVLADPAAEVVVTNYGESAIEYHVRFWTDVQDYWPARNSSLEEIRRCFDEDGVTMTYNHLNVHILEK